MADAPAPPVNSALLRRLTVELERVLAEQGKSLSAAQTQAPAGAYDNDYVYDLGCEGVYYREFRPGMTTPGSIDLRWSHRMVADTNLDGLVSAADLLPIARYFGQRALYREPYRGFSEWYDDRLITWHPAGDPLADGPAWGELPAPGMASYNWLVAAADTNGDGVVGITDIGMLGRHWNEQTTHYELYRQGSYDHEPRLVASMPFFRDLAGQHGLPLPFPVFTASDTHDLQASEYDYYIVPYDAESQTRGWGARRLKVTVEQPPPAHIIESAHGGPAPLTVHFRAPEEWVEEGAPRPQAEYSWEFTHAQKDTGRNWSEPADTYYTFHEPGTYVVRLYQRRPETQVASLAQSVITVASGGGGPGWRVRDLPDFAVPPGSPSGWSRPYLRNCADVGGELALCWQYDPNGAPSRAYYSRGNRPAVFVGEARQGSATLLAAGGLPCIVLPAYAPQPSLARAADPLGLAWEAPSPLPLELEGAEAQHAFTVAGRPAIVGTMARAAGEPPRLGYWLADDAAGSAWAPPVDISVAYDSVVREIQAVEYAGRPLLFIRDWHTAYTRYAADALGTQWRAPIALGGDMHAASLFAAAQPLLLLTNPAYNPGSRLLPGSADASAWLAPQQLDFADYAYALGLHGTRPVLLQSDGYSVRARFAGDASGLAYGGVELVDQGRGVAQCLTLDGHLAVVLHAPDRDRLRLAEYY